MSKVPMVLPAYFKVMHDTTTQWYEVLNESCDCNMIQDDNNQKIQYREGMTTSKDILKHWQLCIYAFHLLF